MKNRIAFQRPKARSLAASFLLCFCPLVCFLIFTDNAYAEEKRIIISAVQIYGQGVDEDFIELYNNTCNDLDISDWKLRKRVSSGAESSIKSFDKNLSIPAKGYFLWANSTDDLFVNTVAADQSTKSSLSENYSIALFDQNDNQVDSLTWGNNSKPFSPTLSTDNPERGYAILRDEEDFLSTINGYNPKNSSATEDESLASCPEEEKEIIDDYEDVSAPNYSYDIRLNEILPNPKGDEKDGEYIELYNDSASSVNLAKWTLKDSSKTKFVFPDGHTIASGGYLTLYRDTFKFALNNTGDEEVFLIDPDGNIVSQAQYENAKENVSFSFDGSAWRWSKYLTPDKPNRFGSSSKIRAEEIKEGYIGVPIEFTLDPEHANFSKVTWDFGDKKKSYLKNPVHTYLKKGKYKVRVSASGETEDVSDSFTLKIKDYPRENVEIVALLPNPYGPDIGQEWIAIRNNSEEIVNLKGWKLASGQATLINHPIRNDLEILPGEISQLTREDAFFTLNNKAMNIELRYPDGKPADKVSYAKNKIGDDEIYSKEDLGWIWISSEEANEEIAVYLDESEQKVLSATDVISDDVYPEGNLSDLGKFSISEEWNEKKKNRAKYLSYGLHIELASDFSEKFALGYFPRRNLPVPEETAFFLEINAFLNKLLFN